MICMHFFLSFSFNLSFNLSIFLSLLYNHILNSGFKCLDHVRGGVLKQSVTKYIKCPFSLYWSAVEVQLTGTLACAGFSIFPACPFLVFSIAEDKKHRALVVFAARGGSAPGASHPALHKGAGHR